MARLQAASAGRALRGRAFKDFVHPEDHARLEAMDLERALNTEMLLRHA